MSIDVATSEGRAALAALTEATTEKKWIAGEVRPDGGVQVYSPSRGVCRQIVPIAETDSAANAAFIAAARTAVPVLLAIIEEFPVKTKAWLTEVEKVQENANNTARLLLDENEHLRKTLELYKDTTHFNDNGEAARAALALPRWRLQ